jgi:hypothetical protein
MLKQGQYGSWTNPFGKERQNIFILKGLTNVPQRAPNSLNKSASMRSERENTDANF